MPMAALFIIIMITLNVNNARRLFALNAVIRFPWRISSATLHTIESIYMNTFWIKMLMRAPSPFSKYSLYTPAKHEHINWMNMYTASMLRSKPETIFLFNTLNKISKANIRATVNNYRLYFFSCEFADLLTSSVGWCHVRPNWAHRRSVFVSAYIQPLEESMKTIDALTRFYEKSTEIRKQNVLVNELW